MSLGINTPSGAAFWTQRVTLDGREYQLSGAWNQRASKWFLTLADEQGSTVHGPRKIVADWDLLRTCTDSRRPPGKLIAFDTSGQGADPGFADIGERVLLTYTPRAEL